MRCVTARIRTREHIPRRIKLGKHLPVRPCSLDTGKARRCHASQVFVSPRRYPRNLVLRATTRALLGLVYRLERALSNSEKLSLVKTRRKELPLAWGWLSCEGADSSLCLLPSVQALHMSPIRPASEGSGRGFEAAAAEKNYIIQ